MSRTPQSVSRALRILSTAILLSALASSPTFADEPQKSAGSIVVRGDLRGVPVYLDDELKGQTPCEIQNVPPGAHKLELRPRGRAPYIEQVVVRPGKQTVVEPTLGEESSVTGSLRVIANVPNAEVWLDGESLGNTPLTKEVVSVGEHVLEATASGRPSIQQTVKVEPGQQRIVALRFDDPKSGSGRIIVNASQGDASIEVDGEDRGGPPVVIEDARPGSHIVVVRSEGFRDYRATCQTGTTRDCDVHAELEPITTEIAVDANVTAARLYVDDLLVGSIPYEGELAIGDHIVEVRAEGFRTYTKKIHLEPSTKTRRFNIELSVGGPELSKEERERLEEDEARSRFGAVTHAAGPLPSDQVAIDLSVGFPHLGELRIGVGILDTLDAGFAVRSFGRLTEFEGRLKVGTRFVRQFGLGLQARFGGGLGPSRDERPVNTFFATLEALGSLNFGNRGALTLWFGADGTTDRYDFSAADSNLLEVPDGKRQLQLRGRFGGVLEIVLDRDWNAWGLIEGFVFGPSTPRRITGDILGFGGANVTFFARLGLTRKF